MGKKDNKETFGFNDKKLQDFLNKNNKIPKGTFQIKKRGLMLQLFLFQNLTL